MQGGGEGADFAAQCTTTPFFNGFDFAESQLKVGMALMNGNNLYQQTALAISQSESCQARLTHSLLHLANSKRD